MSEDLRASARRKSITTLAGNHAEAAIAALVAVMSNAESAPAARIAAANTLLQWSFGKPSGGKEKADQDRMEEGARQVIHLYWAQE